MRPHSVCTCWPLPFPYFGSPMTGGDDDLNHEDYGNICCPLFQRRSLLLCKLTVEQWQHAFIYFMRSWGVVYANIAEDHVCCSWRGKADGRHWWGTEAGPKHNAPRCVNLLIIKVKPIQAINISFVWQTIIGHIYTYIDFNTFWCTRNLSSLRNNSINDQISTLGATSCSLGVHVHARRTINFAEPSKASERPDDSLLILLLIHLQYFLSYFSPWLEDKSHKRLLVLSLLPPKLQRRGLVFKGKMVTMKRVWWVTMMSV